MVPLVEESRKYLFARVIIQAQELSCSRHRHFIYQNQFDEPRLRLLTNLSVFTASFASLAVVDPERHLTIVVLLADDLPSAYDPFTASAKIR